jgi:hypothetical protein
MTMRPDVVRALSQGMLEQLNDHLREEPPNRDRVFEALNALAFAVAYVVVGTGEPVEAGAWFRGALDASIEEATEAQQATERRH